MFVLHKCPTCGEEHVFNIRTRIGYTRRKTRLKNVKITEVIDKEDFINNIRPVIVKAINDGKTIDQIKTQLKNDCGLSYDLADRVIDKLKSHLNIEVKDNKFAFVDPLKVHINK